MKRFKWKFLSIILLVLISYASCENSSPIRQLEPVNKLSSIKPSSNTNLNLKHLDTSEEDETSGDTNTADNDDEDEEDANLDDDENNAEDKDNANDKDEKLDSNTKDDTEDDAEEGDDEDASPVNLAASNSKDKTPLGTFGNKNEKVDKSESSLGGFGSGAAGEDDEEEPDDADEKETDDEKESPLDKSKEVTKEELNKDIFNRDKKQPPLEPPTNNQNSNNNLDDKNKSTITDDDDDETEKDEDEPVHSEDSKNNNNKNVLIDKLDPRDKSKEIATNSILNPVHPEVNLDKSRESNENELEMNNLEGSVSSLGKKDVSKGQISLFAQPLILAVVIGSAVAGLLISIVLVMIILYRLSATTEENYYC